ncbi:capsule biosynthesis GfcC family protein, partial [Paraglaciecola sp.]
GGFTNNAFLGGAVFLRNSVATQQKEVLNRLDVLIERQLTIASSAKAMSALPNSGPTQIADFSKLSQLTNAIAETGLGRVSIDLSAAVAGLGEPIELMDGDSLYVSRIMSTVSVVGEVQVSSSHIYDSDLSLGDYLELAGGTTQFAKESQIYVVRANGQVYQPSRNWFRFTDTELKAGDTVVVPLDVSLTDNLTLWQQVTQIIYNSAISIAAIRGL